VIAARTFGEKQDAAVDDLVGSNLAEAADATTHPPVETVADASDCMDRIHWTNPPFEAAD
jgi:hypothetical protein